MASSSLRGKVRDLLALHRAGQHEEALQGAIALAEMDSSALVLNLLADLRLEASVRTGDSDRDAARKHAQCAVDVYKLATLAAPNCLKTSASYVRALSHLKHHLELVAQDELSRAELIHVPDDPGVHNVCYDLDDTGEILDILKSSGADFAVPAASMVVEPYPFVARAQCLYAHVELVGTLSVDDQKRKEVLREAVCDMRMLTEKYGKSLVISLYYAKLLVIAGDFNGADVECCRGLGIEEPQDPEVDQIPLGLSVGEGTSDGTSAVKKEINALRKLLSTRLQWSLMTIGQRESLKSVNVEMLIKHFSSISPSIANIICTAVSHFKSHNSWSLYICPLPDSICNGFWGNDAGQLDRHFSFRHSSLFPKRPSVSAGTAAIDQGLFSAISLCQDSRQQDILCFRSLDEMLQCLVLLCHEVEPISREAMWLKVQRKAAEILERLQNENNESNEDLWIKLFEASIDDYRTALLPLVSLFKAEDLKNSGDVYFDYFADFDWPFSGEKEELKKRDAASFDSLGDFDWTSPTEHGSTSDGKMDNPNKGIQQEEVQKPVSASLDYLSDWTISGEHGSTPGEKMDNQNGGKHGEMQKSTAAYFDSLLDLDWNFPGEQLSKPSDGETDNQDEVDKEAEVQKPGQQLSEPSGGETVQNEDDEQAEVQKPGQQLSEPSDGETVQNEDDEQAEVQKPGQQLSEPSDGETVQNEDDEQAEVQKPGQQLSEPSDGETVQNEDDEQTCSQDVAGKKHMESPIKATKSLNPQIDIKEKTTNLAVKQTSKGRSKKKERKAPEEKAQMPQSSLYKFSGLHRPMAETVKTTPLSKIDQSWLESRSTNFPYQDEALHRKYQKELAERAPAHLCSFCYFERNEIVEINQISHYTQIHKVRGIKCDFCSARFTSQSALDYHVSYCHETCARRSSEKEKQP